MTTEPSFKALVNAMHNKERNKWARAGYPGLKRKSMDELLPFALPAYRRLGHRKERKDAAQNPLD